MNELKHFDEQDLPIAIPSVELAWADMRSKLEKDEKLKTSLLPRIALVAILMLSWLVITETSLHTTSHRNGTISVNPIIPGTSEELSAKALVINSIKEKKANLTGHVRSKTPSITGRRANVEEELQNFLDTSSTSITTYPDSMPAKKEVPKSKPGIAEMKTDPEEKKRTDKEWNLNGGLQWELQVPTTGMKGYFDGANNTPELWRAAIPAIWLQASQDKNMISFEFNPMFQHMVSRKIFRQQDYITLSVDTLLSNQESKSLYKMLGMSASLGFAKNIKENWWLGGLLQGALWQQALAHSEVKQDMILAPGNVQTRYYDYDYRVTDEWSYFNKFQVFVNAEAFYRKSKWQAGLRTGFAFTPLSKGEGPGNSFRSSVFIRWKILK